MVFIFSSIIMQDTRSEAAYHSTKLCFLILTCVSEDEYANSLMHDPGLTFRVPLHRLPMRHRKSLTDKTLPFRPLVCGLLGCINWQYFSHYGSSITKLSIVNFRPDNRVYSEPSHEEVSARVVRIGFRCGSARFVPSETLSFAIGAVPMERALGSAHCVAQVSSWKRLGTDSQVWRVRTCYPSREYTKPVCYVRWYFSALTAELWRPLLRDHSNASCFWQSSCHG